MIENVTTADCSRPTSDHEFSRTGCQTCEFRPQCFVMTDGDADLHMIHLFEKDKKCCTNNQKIRHKASHPQRRQKKKNFPWCYTPQQNCEINIRLYVGTSCNGSNSLLFIQQPLSWLFTANHNVQLSGSDKMH